MKYRILKISTLLLLTISCSPKANKATMGKYETSKFKEVNNSLIVPEYIGTSINCINLASQVNWEARNPKVVINYFSEYSSIYYFITISDKQIYFETYNDTGTPKPNLIFYAQMIEPTIVTELFNYFSSNQNFEKVNKLSSSDEKTLSLKDEIKQDFGEPFGGDKYPLTIRESSWLIKHNLKLIEDLTNKKITYNENLIRPVFFNMCSYEEEFSTWKSKYPEINNHELKY